MSAKVASGGERLSTLNPNAPLFIPAAYQQVEDFSPEWWKLVETTAWFRDHWFRQHQELETFEDEEVVDVANLLPDSFDLGITEPDFVDEAGFFAAYDVIEAAPALRKEDLMFGNDVESLMRSLNLKSPKNGAVRTLLEPAKYKVPQSAEQKKKDEKEAAERLKREQELREAKRQQQSLNFLISQTELYSHFMQNKSIAQSTDSLALVDSDSKVTEGTSVPEDVEMEDEEDIEEAKLRRQAAMEVAQRAVSEQQDL